jgi:hypothetical protein
MAFVIPACAGMTVHKALSFAAMTVHEALAEGGDDGWSSV